MTYKMLSHRPRTPTEEVRRAFRADPLHFSSVSTGDLRAVYRDSHSPWYQSGMIKDELIFGRREPSELYREYQCPPTV